MQKRRDGALLIEAVCGRKREHIDADKLAVGARRDKPLDGRRRIRYRLPFHRKGCE